MKNAQLVKTIPAGSNPYGWTEQRLYNTGNGYVVAMAVKNPRQDTVDPTTPIHVSADWANKFVEDNS